MNTIGVYHMSVANYSFPFVPPEVDKTDDLIMNHDYTKYDDTNYKVKENIFDTEEEEEKEEIQTEEEYQREMDKLMYELFKLYENHSIMDNFSELTNLDFEAPVQKQYNKRKDIQSSERDDIIDVEIIEKPKVKENHIMSVEGDMENKTNQGQGMMMKNNKKRKL